MLKTVLFSLLAFSTLSCPNDTRCASCIGTTCTLCYDGFLEGGRCFSTNNRISNCVSYRSQDACYLCQDGYYVNELGKCAAIKMKDCKQLESNNPEVCKICKKNIFVNNGQCTKNILFCDIPYCEHCAKFNDAGIKTCTGCAGGYVLKTQIGGINTCVKQQDFQQNCFKLDNMGNCQACNMRYYMSDNKCLKSNAYNYGMGSGILSTFVIVLGYLFF